MNKIYPGYHVKVKPRRVMGDWIAAHGSVPKSQLPPRLQNIPKKQIWVRRDVYDRKTERNHVLLHEKRELGYINKDHVSYEKAHRKTLRCQRSYR